MDKPLMPKATALWLMNNTTLTLEQVATFCGFHPLQVTALIDSERNTLQEVNPLINGQLTSEEISRCEKDPEASLQLQIQIATSPKKSQRRKYTPLSKRSEVPSSVFWLIKNFPLLPDAQICRLLSTTKNTVQSIREGRHRDMKELSPRDPVLLGLCSQEELDALIKQIPENIA